MQSSSREPRAFSTCSGCLKRARSSSTSEFSVGCREVTRNRSAPARRNKALPIWPVPPISNERRSEAGKGVLTGNFWVEMGRADELLERQKGFIGAQKHAVLAAAMMPRSNPHEPRHHTWDRARKLLDKSSGMPKPRSQDCRRLPRPPPRRPASSARRTASFRRHHRTV